MHQLMVMFEGQLDLALAAYNAGVGNVLKAGGRVPPNRETPDFVRKVTERYVQLRGAVASATATSSTTAAAAAATNASTAAAESLPQPLATTELTPEHATNPAGTSATELVPRTPVNESP